MDGFKIKWKVAKSLRQRSILADLSDKIKDKLNIIVKKRSLIDLAPAVLDEYKDKYFNMTYDSDYMILSADVLNEKQK